MLLVGFLTPVVLFGSLTISLMNSNSSEVKAKTMQKYAVTKEYLPDELSLEPKAHIYKQDTNEEEVTISPDTDCIRFRDALLPNIGRS